MAPAQSAPSAAPAPRSLWPGRVLSGAGKDDDAVPGEKQKTGKIEGKTPDNSGRCKGSGYKASITTAGSISKKIAQNDEP